MQVTIRLARAEDAGRLNDALAQLSADLGDTHHATPEMLGGAGWGENPAFRANLAEMDGRTVGASLYSPFVSTAQGMAGVYVADLWVAPGMRGQRLGPRILSFVMQDAARAWDARFMKLNVYHVSRDARRFYDRLGFIPAEYHTEMLLDAAGCDRLKGLT